MGLTGDDHRCTTGRPIRVVCCWASVRWFSSVLVSDGAARFAFRSSVARPLRNGAQRRVSSVGLWPQTLISIDFPTREYTWREPTDFSEHAPPALTKHRSERTGFLGRRPNPTWVLPRPIRFGFHGVVWPGPGYPRLYFGDPFFKFFFFSNVSMVRTKFWNHAVDGRTSAIRPFPEGYWCVESRACLPYQFKTFFKNDMLEKKFYLV